MKGIDKNIDQTEPAVGKLDTDTNIESRTQFLNHLADCSVESELSKIYQSHNLNFSYNKTATEFFAECQNRSVQSSYANTRLDINQLLQREVNASRNSWAMFAERQKRIAQNAIDAFIKSAPFNFLETFQKNFQELSTISSSIRKAVPSASEILSTAIVSVKSPDPDVTQDFADNDDIYQVLLKRCIEKSQSPYPNKKTLKEYYDECVIPETEPATDPIEEEESNTQSFHFADPDINERWKGILPRNRSFELERNTPQYTSSLLYIYIPADVLYYQHLSALYIEYVNKVINAFAKANRIIQRLKCYVKKFYRDPWRIALHIYKQGSTLLRVLSKMIPIDGKEDDFLNVVLQFKSNIFSIIKFSHNVFEQNRNIRIDQREYHPSGKWSSD